MAKVYVCQSLDDTLLRQSASGGAFSLLARSVLARGGAVFGAVWKDGRCVHDCARSEEGLAAMRGSKYLQSDLGDTFRQAKELLDQKVPVLYSGTPCQLVSLAAFLGRDEPDLISVDLVCHGVPEGKAWDAYAARFTQSPLTAAFRDKTEGWRRYSVRFTFPDGSAYRKPYTEDPFIRAYISNLSLRTACLHCKSNTSAKRSDITLGDDWGFELKDDGDKGTSLILTHTEKGGMLFDTVRGQMRVMETSFARAAAANPVLLAPSKPHPKREEFLRRVDRDNFDQLVALWDKPAPRWKQFLQKVKRKISGQ